MSADFLLPMAAIVAMSMLTLMILGPGRLAQIKAGNIKLSYYKVGQGGVEPEATAKINRAFINLQESPTMFYAGCCAALALSITDATLLNIAWAYVAARAAHLAVFLTINNVNIRFLCFIISIGLLAAFWVKLVLAA